jgi:hypothetical protein
MSRVFTDSFAMEAISQNRPNPTDPIDPIELRVPRNLGPFSRIYIALWDLGDNCTLLARIVSE